MSCILNSDFTTSSDLTIDFDTWLNLNIDFTATCDFHYNIFHSLIHVTFITSCDTLHPVIHYSMWFTTSCDTLHPVIHYSMWFTTSCDILYISHGISTLCDILYITRHSLHRVTFSTSCDWLYHVTCINRRMESTIQCHNRIGCTGEGRWMDTCRTGCLDSRGTWGIYLGYQDQAWWWVGVTGI